MNESHQEKNVARRPRSFDWVLEILLVVAITPAIVYGVSSLNHLPIV